MKKIKFLDATNILVNSLHSKDKKIIKNVLLFFLFSFLLVIIIKIPFIYVRDMISNLFIDTFKNDDMYKILTLIFEFIYALTAILILIKKIKNKALELEKEDSQ